MDSSVPRLIAAIAIVVGLILVLISLMGVFQETRAIRLPEVGATLDMGATAKGGATNVGVESGSMAWATATAMSVAAAAVADAATPMDVFGPTAAPTPAPTNDPCPPSAIPGPASGAQLTAIGVVRLYPAADFAQAAPGQFTAGTVFVVAPDPGGTTAITRCELTWLRVRTPAGAEGWIVAQSVDDMPLQPTGAPTAISTLVQQCVSGSCQGCVHPCPTPCSPCSSPCNYQPNQPCYQPCGTAPCSNTYSDQKGGSYPGSDYGSQQACGDAGCTWTYPVNPNP